ncbi:MAG: DNA polymerase [Verrucomicrobiales bacterium]|nr:DNA polymerase [Verrucomicrobiales bacterium]|tara:strand:+ start:20914 stop:21849 length:936 start_codon:yes stop_codon:yes gene_type:complete
MSNEFLWVEKYRPQTISDCILPDALKKTFQEIINNKELPNMLFSGTAGLGKTTVAKALCNQLGLDFILINGSEEGNIDTLRGKIKQFASSVSLQGGYKVVILDEADYLNPQSTQPALRGFIEEFSNNCRFILTCNFKNRIIEPLHSRCGVYEFNTTKKDMVTLCESMLSRTTFILKEENVQHNVKDIAPVIMKHAPDWRRVLNELQRASVSGTYIGLSSSSTGSSIDELVKLLKDKDFKKMRTWVVNNMDMDATAIFRSLYDQSTTYIKPQSIPQLVLILADYQYKHAFVADHELNVVACLTEIMANVEFA